MKLKDELLSLQEEANRIDKIRIYEFTEIQYKRIVEKLKQAAKIGKNEVDIDPIFGCSKETFYIKDQIKKAIVSRFRKEDLVVSLTRRTNNCVKIKW